MSAKSFRTICRSEHHRRSGRDWSSDSGKGQPVGAGHDEAGAVLILALVFLITVSLIVGALMSWATNDLNNTSKFASARSLQYAATSATETAIQAIRYTPLLWTGQTLQTLNASPPSYCWGSGPSSQLTTDGDSMTVWCSTAWTPTSANSRVVTFSACQSSVSAALCASNPVLQAVVTFDDYPPLLVSSPTTGQCVVYCGTAITVNSWLWSPTVPTVTALSSNAGLITGGTSLAITGSGFISGATSVNFIEESNGTPATDNVVLTVPPSKVTFNSSGSVTVSTPSVTEGSSYFVTVTTPTGASAYNATSAFPVFTYSLVAPSVAAVSPSSYTTPGGTAVTITGSGFFGGATVNFVEENGGVLASPQVILPATSVAVVRNATTGVPFITAVTPAVTVGTTYYVTVTTPAGTSSYSTSPVFTYMPIVPTISSISPVSGPITGGTSVQITGTGFFTGATVNFVKESAGTAVSPSVIVAATSVAVTGATTLTAVTPAVASGTTYFVTVTTPAGGLSGYGPVFTF
jgi:hypothetical protein